MNCSLTVVLLLLLLGEGAWLYWRGRTLAEIRAHAALPERADVSPAVSPVMTAAVASTLTLDQRKELLTLRGQVAQLRREVQTTSRRMEETRSGRPPRTEVAPVSSAQMLREIYGPDFFAILSKVSGVVLAAVNQHGTIPEAFTPGMLAQLDDEATGVANSLELLPGEKITPENDCCVIVARQREGRQTSEGKWVRLYVLANGQPLVAHENGAVPDWERWERKQLGSLRESMRRRMEPPVR